MIEFERETGINGVRYRTCTRTTSEMKMVNVDVNAILYWEIGGIIIVTIVVVSMVVVV